MNEQKHVREMIARIATHQFLDESVYPVLAKLDKAEAVNMSATYVMLYINKHQALFTLHLRRSVPSIPLIDSGFKEPLMRLIEGAVSLSVVIGQSADHLPLKSYGQFPGYESLIDRFENACSMIANQLEYFSRMGEYIQLPDLSLSIAVDEMWQVLLHITEQDECPWNMELLLSSIVEEIPT